jgi:hypothetical protein
MAKSILKTIRFTPTEEQSINEYLRRNRAFDSLSSLGRVAVMEFIRTRTTLPLSPLSHERTPARPSFLWDYDLTEAQVHEILQHEPFEQRKWLIARILERAPLEEVWRYLTMEQIRDALPHLRMDPKTQRHWQEAIELWTSRPSRS